MAVKVIVHERPIQIKHFPKLMIGKSSVIVLFFKENTGVIIKDVLYETVGYYSDQFKMPDFEDYNEPITLQNDCHDSHNS
jgi:hypothetical protein